MKILFAEDDAVSIKKVKTILKQDDYDLTVVNSGKEAIKLLKVCNLFDVVITAIKIHDVDGFGLVKYIRNSLRYKHLPVILTTSLNDKKTIIKATEFGISAYLLKPFHDDCLISALDEISKNTYSPILIVDDEEFIRSLLTKVLEREGFHVETASDGVDALHVLEQKDISIIISDIKMPNMTGLELLVRVKEEYPEIPILLMTGHGLDFTKEEAIISGANDYITKPFKNVEIANKIHICLKHSKKELTKK